jgi:hypothetical protein
LKQEEREKVMSTRFGFSKKVSAGELFGGKLEKFGVRELVTSDTSEKYRCLTDGSNYLWVHIHDDWIVLSRQGGNAPGKIPSAIAEAFETEIFSEYEPQFWGFDSQEEWDAKMKEMDDRHREEVYADVCAYVRGEPNDIQRTIGETKAKIAKKLAEEDATIVGDKDRLLGKIDAIYQRDHAVVFLRPDGLSRMTRKQQEEWDAAMKEIYDQKRQKFYADVCAYVRGEPNDIRPGTVGETQAKIAKKLVEEDATIIGDKDWLLAVIEGTAWHPRKC